MHALKNNLPCARECAVIQASDKPAAENTELHEALKRTFKALDQEKTQAALASDVKECHIGGTTALMALINDRVSSVGPLDLPHASTLFRQYSDWLVGCHHTHGALKAGKYWSQICRWQQA